MLLPAAALVEASGNSVSMKHKKGPTVSRSGPFCVLGGDGGN